MRKVRSRAKPIVRMARGACLLLWLASVAQAQAPPSESPLENPFPEQKPGLYQVPDEQILPLLPQGIPPAIPDAGGFPMPQQTPQPVSLGDLVFGDNRQTPEDYRSGAFQKLSFVNTYLPRFGGEDGFGIYGVELTSVWGIPCPTTNAPLVITPGFGTQWLDGPAGLNVPPQLHEVYTEFRWLPKLGDRFRVDIAVQPSYNSDWEGSSDRAVRIMGHGSAIFDWTPHFQIVLGCAYLDRPDIELLPIAGFIWTPDRDVEYRLVFPAPKISWRVWDNSVPTIQPPRPTTDLWLYLAGELGGGTWAIRHSDGESDLMSYSDIRVFLGLETKSLTLIGSQIEIGYVFHRYIRLTSTNDNFDVADTLMVRAALNY
jgi:hypothetical protein